MLKKCKHIFLFPKMIQQCMMTGVFTSGVFCVLEAVRVGCPVDLIAALHVAGVDLNQDALGVNLLRSAIRYLRDDVLEFCLNIITDQPSKNEALEYSMRDGTLCTVEILVHHGADLHHKVNHDYSEFNKSSLLNYALSCGRFEKLVYLLDHGIEPGDASISILLNNLSVRTSRFPRNNYPWSGEVQMTVQYHLEVQNILELLLSRRPQLIDDNWNGVHSVPLQVAIRNSQVCLVVKLIQYGANLEGMEGLTLEILRERTQAYNIHASKPLHALATLLAIVRASISLHQLPWIETKSNFMHCGLVCLNDRATNPCRLQELCRATIVGKMHGRAWPAVPHLGLPLPLQRYLRYEDLITDISVCLCPDSPRPFVPVLNTCLCIISSSALESLAQSHWLK